MISNTKNKRREGLEKVARGEATGTGETGRKIVRDLREEFDQYVLKEDDQPDSNIKEREDEDQQEDGNEQNIQPAASHKTFQHSIKKPSLSTSNSKIKIKQVLSSTHVNPQLPRSYLLALESLQSSLESKDSQILTLKEQLIEKQQIILQCESKINEVLLRYHQLLDLYGFKESQLQVLRGQMDELRRDREVALKRAARALQGEFRDGREVAAGNVYVDEGAFTTFKTRAMSTNLGPYPKEPLMTAAYSKQLLHPSDAPNLKHSNFTTTQLYKPQPPSKPQLPQPPKTSTARAPHTKSSPLYSPLYSPSLLPPHEKDHNFVSYQREILRNEKELIAMKYRMECLERKLSVNPREDGVKMKIRKLSQEIQGKERAIGNLKGV